MLSVAGWAWVAVVCVWAAAAGAADGLRWLSRRSGPAGGWLFVAGLLVSGCEVVFACGCLCVVLVELWAAWGAL